MNVKQILALHLDGYSNRKIGSVMGFSRNTVNTKMQLSTANDSESRIYVISWEKSFSC